MPTISISPNELFLFFIFIFTGGICHKIIDKVIISEAKSDVRYVIDCVFLSLIILFLYRILAYGYHWFQFRTSFVYKPSIELKAFALVVIAMALGFFYGIFLKNGWINKLPMFIQKPFSAIFTISAIPRSWDYMFNKMKPKWLIITLQNDSKIAAVFTNSAFASSSPNEEDLLISEWYPVIAGKVDTEMKNTMSLYLKKDEIKFIEIPKEIKNG
jgi:hypothetical protein